MNQQKFENAITVLFVALFTFLCVYGAIVVPPIVKSYSVKPTIIVQRVEETRPTYEYLKSVTLYMYHIMGSLDDKEVLAGRATASIVKIEDGVAYVLTNHHICESDNENCYASLEGKGKRDDFIKLTYVKTGDWENGIDLELWTADASLLVGKQAVKGFKSISHAERAYSVGNYLGYPYIYTEGTMAGYDPDGQLFNLPCVFGCSGSGIFNRDGYMVAVLYAGYNVPTTVSVISSKDTAKVIAVPYTEVMKFLKGIINEE